MSAECQTDWLSAYLDGELPLEMVARVELHLQHCEACRRRLTRMEQADMLLAAAVPAPAPDLASRILAMLPEASPTLTPAGEYADLGAWGAVAMAAGGLLFFLQTYPALMHLVRTLHSLNMIFWTTGVLHLQDPAEAYRLAGLLLLAGVVGLLATYGTRLLDRPEEVAQ